MKSVILSLVAAAVLSVGLVSTNTASAHDNCYGPRTSYYGGYNNFGYGGYGGYGGYNYNFRPNYGGFNYSYRPQVNPYQNRYYAPQSNRGGVGIYFRF